MKLITLTQSWAMCYQCGAQSEKSLAYFHAEKLAEDQGFVPAMREDFEIVLCGECALKTTRLAQSNVPDKLGALQLAQSASLEGQEPSNV